MAASEPFTAGSLRGLYGLRLQQVAKTANYNDERSSNPIVLKIVVLVARSYVKSDWLAGAAGPFLSRRSLIIHSYSSVFRPLWPPQIIEIARSPLF